ALILALLLSEPACRQVAVATRNSGGGGREMPRPGTAPHGRGLKQAARAGGDRPIGRARRPAGHRLKRAARPGGRFGRSVRRSAPRSTGSSKRRRRRGQAPRSPARRVLSAEGKRRLGGGGWAPGRGLYPLCRAGVGGRAEAGAPCTPPRQARRRLPASSSPRGPCHPFPVTQSGQAGPPRRHKSGIPPPAPPPPGFGPLVCELA